MKLIQEGPKSARIVIVGEAPGLSEASKGIPFVGASGQLLDEVLGEVRIRRSECFVTNVCHEQPPKNDFNWFYKTQAGNAALMQGMLQLRKDLTEIKPNLILALGGQPLKVLTGKDGISKWRGSVLECALVPGLKVLATFHPASVFRVWENKCVIELDMHKAALESRFPEIKRIKREFILNPPAEVRAQVTKEMLQADWLAVDIECWQDKAGKWELSCIGFADRCNRGMVVNLFNDTSGARIDVATLLASPVKKVMQNGTFDTSVLREAGFVVNNFSWDTMLAHHALYAESAGGGDELSGEKKTVSPLRKGLGFINSIYTDIPFYKDDSKIWKETNDIEMFWRYNALDAMATREIQEKQVDDLRSLGVYPILEHSMSLVEPTMSMTKRGIKIDLACRDRLIEKYELECARLQSFLETGAGHPVNVSSTKDVPALLYDQLKLSPIRKRRAGGGMTITADKDAINKLASKYDNPLLLSIIKIRQRRTLLERYLHVPLDSDGRMRCLWNIAGTKSGRLSSGAGLNGSGTNLQNQPSAIREMYIADEGKVLISADYSQAEARVVAYLARDPYLIELFNDPTRDIHKETAAKIFNKPVSEITFDERYIGKRVRHAVNYGMDAGRFVEVVNEDADETGVRIDERLAKRAIEGFFFMHPNHKPVFWGDVQQQLRQTRILSSAFGRKRIFFGRWGEDLFRSGYSHYPQSSVGDLCCKALVRIYNEVELGQPSTGCNVLLNVHDSIVVQCWEHQLKHVAAEMKRCMDIPLTVDGHIFKIPTDVEWGYNWMKQDKITNPKGLRKLQ